MCVGGRGGVPSFSPQSWVGVGSTYLFCLLMLKRGITKDTTAKVTLGHAACHKWPSWVRNRTDALLALWLHYTEIVPSWGWSLYSELSPDGMCACMLLVLNRCEATWTEAHTPNGAIICPLTTAYALLIV